MAFTVFPDTAKVAVNMSWNGVEVSNVLHFQHASPTDMDYEDLAASVSQEWTADILPEQVSELTIVDVTAYDLSEEGAPKYVNTDDAGAAGSDLGDGVPNNTCMLISHRTADTGRSSRGRTYIPGMLETDESNGLMVAAKQTNMVTAWGNFIAAVALIGWDLVVAQRFSGGTQLAIGVARAVTVEIIKRQLGTQRRRQVPSAI